MTGSEHLCIALRALTSAKLYLNAEHYSSHHILIRSFYSNNGSKWSNVVYSSDVAPRNPTEIDSNQIFLLWKRLENLESEHSTKSNIPNHVLPLSFKSKRQPPTSMQNRIIARKRTFLSSSPTGTQFKIAFPAVARDIDIPEKRMKLNSCFDDLKLSP